MEGSFLFRKWGKGYLNGDDNDDTSISNNGILHCLSILKFNDNIHIIIFM